MPENGKIYLESSKRQFEYNTEQFEKDDAFITVGMLDEKSWEDIQKGKQEYAEIGATVLDHDVLAPAQAVNTRTTKYKYPAQFRISRNK